MNRSHNTSVNRDRWRRYGAFVASVAERARHGASYNPLSERTIQNPYPVYVRLRQHSPVHRCVILGSWILSRYADVLAVARDHERFSNDPRWRNAAASVLPPAPDDYSILLVDPPEHTRLRKVAARAFIRSDSRKRGATAPVTRELAREVMVRTALFARILSQFWLFDAVVRARAPAPELCNTDDEAMLLCEVRFPLTADAARVAEVLDGIEGFEREEDGEPRWKWFAAGSPLYRASRHRPGQSAMESSENPIGTTSLGYIETRKGTLVLSVNSRERAERGRELLTLRLAGLVGPALIAHQTPERAQEERSGQPPDEPEVPPEEALQVIHSYLDDHYRRTLDDPLPMFDGKTLREAAATGKERDRVVDWLKQLENAEHHRAAQHGHRPYDTAWLWRELGIEAPR